MRKGFTLIEILVTMALFLTIMLVVSHIFLTVTVVQNKTLGTQKAMNDLSFVMEQMADDVRKTKINYDLYGMVMNPVSELHLLNGESEEIVWFVDSMGCAEAVNNCLKRSVAGMDEVMSSAEVDVGRLDFYLMPDEEMEFEAPKVTIVLSGMPIADQEPKEINLQTTVSSRSYE